MEIVHGDQPDVADDRAGQHFTTAMSSSIDWLASAETANELLQSLPQAPNHEPTLVSTAGLPKLKTRFSHSPLLRASTEGQVYAAALDSGAEPLEELDDRDEVELMAEEHNLSPASSSLKQDQTSRPVEGMETAELQSATETACTGLLAILTDGGNNADGLQSEMGGGAYEEDAWLVALLGELRQVLRDNPLGGVPGGTSSDVARNTAIATEGCPAESRSPLSEVLPGRGDGLRNPFKADEDRRMLQSAASGQREGEEYALAVMLSGMLGELQRRCTALLEERRAVQHESGVKAVLYQLNACEPAVRERQRRLRAVVHAARRRSALSSPRSSSFSLTSQRSSRAPSPAMNDSCVGDPVGEAMVAGLGLGAATPQSRRSSIAFLPNSTSLDRRSSVKSGHEIGQRNVHSPPPRYSLESTRSWASNVFPPLGAADVESSSAVHSAANGAEKVRRLSTSSDNTFGVHGGILTHPPAYVTEKQHHHKTWSDRKASSSSSLLALSDSTKVGFRYMKGSMDKGYVHLRSRSEATSAPAQEQREPQSSDLNIVQRSLDRFYSATPQMSDQRAARKPEPLRRLSQREGDIALMIDRLVKTDRLDDQRAASPRLRSQDVDEPTSSTAAPSPARAETIGRSRRLASVGSLSFAPLRRASLLWSGTSKGKEKQHEHTSDVAQAAQRSASISVEPTRSRGWSRDPEFRSTTDKLGRMGLEVRGMSDMDDILDLLSSSKRMSRLPNQDAVLRPRPTDAAVGASTPTSAKGKSADPAGGQEGDEVVRSKSGGPVQDVSHTDPLDERRRSELGTRQAVDQKPEILTGSKLRYIAETQQRLGAVVATVWDDGGSHRAEGSSMQYHTDLGGGRSGSFPRLSVRIGSEKAAFRLPARTTGEGTIEKSAVLDVDKWVARLPWDGSEGSSSGPAVPYSVADLNSMGGNKRWSCEQCATVIADLSATTKYIPLPSQHWEELVEAWMCHEDQELNQTLIKAQEGLDRHAGLHEGQVHVSEQQMIVGDAMIISDAVLVTETGQARCRTCAATLGRAKRRERAMLLYKLAIKPAAESGVIGRRTPPLSVFVALDLIQHASAHATRRFIVESDDDEDRPGRPELVLWLFVDSCGLSVSPTLLFPAHFLGSKVMYRRCAQPSDEQTSWTDPASHDRLFYPKRVIERLLVILDTANAAYPPSQRALATPALSGAGTDSWRVGFLPFS